MLLFGDVTAMNSHLHKTSTISSYQNFSISANRINCTQWVKKSKKKKRKNGKNMKMGGLLSDFSIAMIRNLWPRQLTK